MQPSYYDWECVLDFYYTGFIRLTERNVTKIAQLAKSLRDRILLDHCTRFMIRDLDCGNAVEKFALAYQYNCDRVQEKVVLYLANNFERFVESGSFLLSFQSLLSLLLSLRDLVVYDESVVLDAVLRWVKANPDERTRYQKELLANLNWDLINNSSEADNATLCRLRQSCVEDVATRLRRRTYYSGLYLLQQNRLFHYSPLTTSLKGIGRDRIAVDATCAKVRCGRRLYFFQSGERKVKCFDVRDRAPVDVAALPTARTNPCVFAHNGNVYVLGSHRDKSPLRCQVYTGGGGDAKWTASFTARLTRFQNEWRTQTVFLQGRVAVCDYRRDGWLACELWDPELNQAEVLRLPTLEPNQHYHHVTAYGQYLLLFAAAQTTGGGCSHFVDVYDPVIDDVFRRTVTGVFEPDCRFVTGGVVQQENVQIVKHHKHLYVLHRHTVTVGGQDTIRAKRVCLDQLVKDITYEQLEIGNLFQHVDMDTKFGPLEPLDFVSV